jgi:radical SAM superfamily enzyme YgiQ (UPF0313 family)
MNLMMNVLLIYPDYPDTFWSFKHALKFISKKATEPPLGLLTTASLLPWEWEKKLIHMKVTPLRDKHLDWADMVFISAMSIQQSSARQVIDRCKKKGVKVVAGGPLFTTAYDQFPEVDHLILNEAEITLPQFLEDLKMGTPKPIYKSDTYADITTTPTPSWELIKMKNYATMGIQYSRGCPFHCDFCNISALYGHDIRTKSKTQVLTELDALYAHGWRGGVFFVDDNFIGNKRKLKTDILPAMIHWMQQKNYPFSFKTEASINLADDDHLLSLMVKAGFDSVFVGIETPNENSLAECNKIQNKNRDMVASVKKMQDAGLQVDAGFIVGFDNDLPNTFVSLVNFIKDSRIITAMVGLLNAPRGSKLYNRMHSEGRLIKEISGDNTDLSMNFIPKMDKQILINGYKSIINNIYAPKEYYKRVKNFLRESIPLPKKAFSLQMGHVKALIKSVVRLGIVGRERIHFWNLFFWTLIKQPKQFPRAITFAIYGFHFRKIFKSSLQLN